MNKDTGQRNTYEDILIDKLIYEAKDFELSDWKDMRVNFFKDYYKERDSLTSRIDKKQFQLQCIKEYKHSLK